MVVRASRSPLLFNHQRNWRATFGKPHRSTLNGSMDGNIYQFGQTRSAWDNFAMKIIDSKSKRKVKIQLAVLLLCLAPLGGMLWLHQEVTLPISAACRLRVLDETGKPVPKLAVTHSWGRSLDWNGSDHKLT